MKAVPTILMVLLVAACLAGPLIMRPHLGELRTEHSADLVALPDNAPPLVVFATVALGGLRGIVIDMLWNRLDELKYEGDVVEVVQLADWVTKLEPRLPETWDYHSFNIAYNISAMFRDPDERWRWVSEGIRMLRDEALVYNPDSIVLYDRLCRIFKHKLMDRNDPARNYYRYFWAEEMNELLGGPRPDYRLLAEKPDRAEQIMEEYRLDPVLMKQIDESYGPFDWILPEPHVIYWARAGLAATGEEKDEVFDRLLCQCMISTFLQGRIERFSVTDRVLETSVRLDILPRVTATILSTVQSHGAMADRESLLYLMYVGFLRRGILLLYDMGRKTEAGELFALLKDTLDEKDRGRSLDEYLPLLKAAPDPAEAAEGKRLRRIAKQAEDHHH